MVGHRYGRFPDCIQGYITRDGKCITGIILYRSVRRSILIGIPALKDVTRCRHGSLIENRYVALPCIRALRIRLLSGRCRKVLIIGYRVNLFPNTIQIRVLCNNEFSTGCVLHGSVRRRGLIGIPSLKDIITRRDHATLTQNGYRVSVLVRAL